MTASAAARAPARSRPRRLLALACAALLAGCAEQPPPPTDFAPLTYDYLTKLRLAVATIDIANAWTANPVAGGQHVESLSPVQPVDALRRMAQDRLIPAGTGGHAAFVIEDASLVQTPAGYEGSMQVHIDLTGADGAKAGSAEATVRRTRTIVDTSPAATRAALYELTKQMMADMNVEFEFQVRSSLRGYLQTGTDIAPPPPPVQSQDLNPAPDTTAPPPVATPAPNGGAPNGGAPNAGAPDAAPPTTAAPNAAAPDAAAPTPLQAPAPDTPAAPAQPDQAAPAPQPAQ